MDSYGTKRGWMLSMQLTLAILFTGTAFFVPFQWAIPTVAIFFFVGAILAATHDTSIDGYYLVSLSKEDQARFVGYRVMAYRIAMMAGTGGVVTIGTTIGWIYAFLAAGVLLGLLFLYHLFFLPRSETVLNPIGEIVRYLLKLKFIAGASACFLIVGGLRYSVNTDAYNQLKVSHPIFKEMSFAAWISVFLFSGLVLVALFKNQIRGAMEKKTDSNFSRAFISYIDRKNAGLLLSFIILLRAGEFLLSNMSSPFMIDLGVKVHIGWISAGVGLPASIAGALFGGYLISKLTLQKVMFPFLLAQNLTNLIYMAIAFLLASFVTQNTGNDTPVFVGTMNLIGVAAVHGFDQFSGGLGTSVLMTFLMRMCFGEFKAAHYAIGSGLMSLSGLFTGIISGILANSLGYGYFFGVSFLVSVPAMILAFPALRMLRLMEET
jgi:PAT family beta-lactamase induction signal transducer AmpG